MAGIIVPNRGSKQDDEVLVFVRAKRSITIFLFRVCSSSSGSALFMIANIGYSLSKSSELFFCFFSLFFFWFCLPQLFLAAVPALFALPMLKSIFFILH
jgi:hypothetical protein